MTTQPVHPTATAEFSLAGPSPADVAAAQQLLARIGPIVDRRLRPAARPARIAMIDLARKPFRVTDALQRQWTEARRGSDSGPARDVILVVEHDPVITVSRRANPRHVLWDADRRARVGIDIAPVDRGGDVTFHGPGQIVVYPLLDLTGTGLGASAYMHRLEQLVINALRPLGIAARPDPAMPGVWVDQRDNQSAKQRARPAKKIAAVGARVSRSLTRHGLALNHTTDLAWFDSIVPCGLAGLTVTSIATELPQAPPSRASVLAAIADAWTAQDPRGRAVGIHALDPSADAV